MIFLHILPRKQALTFPANCHLRGQFASKCQSLFIFILAVIVDIFHSIPLNREFNRVLLTAYN